MSSTVVLNFHIAKSVAEILSKGTITVDGAEKTLADFGATLKDNVITLPGYGRLNVASIGSVEFTLNADAPASAYTFMQDTIASGSAHFSAVDASAMTNAFTLGKDVTLQNSEQMQSIKTGSGNDVLDLTGTALIYPSLTTIDAGDGDNTITLSGTDTRNVTSIKGGSGSDTVTLNAPIGGPLTVDLGAGGADTIDLELNQTKDITVNNYIYSEGDVIKVKGNGSVAGGGVLLSDAGNITFYEEAGIGVTTTVKAALENNVYKARVTGTTEGVEKTSEYWMVGTDSTAITLDASSMTNDVEINASKAQSATVVSGMGNDDITVSSTGKTMITLGKASGTDTVKVTGGALTTSQTLNLVGGSLENIAVDTAAATTLDYVNTKLAGALAADSGSFNVSFDGGTTAGKLQYAKTGTLEAATDAVYFLGTAGTTTLKTAAAGVNLLDTAKYKGITQVSVAGGGKGTFVGNADTKSVIDGGSATDSLAIWGGSKDVDTITAGTQGKAADTIWFGKSDGNDVITGFDAGFGSTADVLKLYDAASLADVTFTSNGNKNFSVKAGSSQAVVTRVDATTENKADQDHILVELMDGTRKKVAISTTDGSFNWINGVGADAVIGDAASTAINQVIYDGTQTDAFTVDLNNTVAANTQYTNISNIDASKSTGDGTLIGKIGGNSNIYAGSGTNNIWGGSTDANNILLAEDAGTDTIWFGSTDGKDTVAYGFQAATDTVRFYEASSAADIVKSYVLRGGSSATIELAAATDTQELLLQGSGADGGRTYNFTVGTASDSTVYKAALAIVPDIAFSTDTVIYGGGSTKVVADHTVTGTVVVDMANAGSYGNYYFDSRILEFDASGSSAAFTLVGRGDKYSTIRGGAAKNDLWGGGYAKQDMYGNNAAVDTIWFGRNDGGDTVSTLDKGDTINLYDVTSIGDVTMTKVDANKYSLSLGTSGLTITDKNFAAIQGGLTFQTMDGSKYTYDTTNSRFVAKA